MISNALIPPIIGKDNEKGTVEKLIELN